MKTFVAISLFLIAQSTVLGQVYWVENFDYPTGSIPLVPDGNWDEYEGGNPVQVISTDLTYPGYPASGHRSITISNSGGQDIFRKFAESPQTNSIYVSFVIKVSSAPTSVNGGNFLFFDEDGNHTITGLVWVKDEGNDSLKFGITKGMISGPEPTPVFSNRSFAKSDSHLIVIKYEFNGGSFDDTVRLWINPTLSGSEPTEDAKAAHFSVPDASGLYALGLEQTAGGVSANIDGIRAGKTWSDAPLPVQLTSLTAVGLKDAAEIKWSTATEMHNYGFEIERRSIGAGVSVGESNNPSVERSVWHKVGFVPGSGTSASPREYVFVDRILSPGRYAYRLKQIDMDGSFSYSLSTEVEVGAASRELMLSPGYPNPFNPSTTIEFTVPEDGFAVLKVFNLLGQEVAVLFEGQARAGQLYSNTFEARALPTGVYLSRLSFGGRSLVERIVLAK